MAEIAAPAVVVAQLIGSDPLSGVVFAAIAGNLTTPLIGYDEGAARVTLPHAVYVATPVTAGDTLVARFANLSADVLARARLELATSTVTVTASAVNATATRGGWIGTTSAHPLYLMAGGASTLVLNADGTVRVGATDPGGTAALRVAGSVNVSGAFRIADVKRMDTAGSYTVLYDGAGVQAFAIGSAAALNQSFYAADYHAYTDKANTVVIATLFKPVNNLDLGISFLIPSVGTLQLHVGAAGTGPGGSGRAVYAL